MCLICFDLTTRTGVLPALAGKAFVSKKAHFIENITNVLLA
jgi:hypothetical protein